MTKHDKEVLQELSKKQLIYLNRTNEKQFV